MNAALFAYSRRGCATARRVMAALADWDIQPYTMERFAEDGFAPLGRRGSFTGQSSRPCRP